jgi:tetratricopeptide (TPR) repeat protein
MLHRLESGAPSVRASEPAIPHRLARLVDACLDGDPARRPTAERLQRGLERCAGRSPRRMVWFGAAALLVLIGVAAGRFAGRPSAPVEPADAPLEPAPEVAPAPAGPFDRGVAFLRGGDIAAAMKAFDDARQARPSGAVYAYLAYCHSRSASHRLAANFYRLAIDRGYPAAWVHNNLSVALTRFAQNVRGEMEAAVAEAARARELDGDLWAPRFNWAYARFLLNRDAKQHRLDDPDCVRELLAALGEAPADADADLYYLAAEILAAASAEDAKLADSAITFLRRAVELGKRPSQIPKNPVFPDRLSGHPAYQPLLDLPTTPAAPRASDLRLLHPSGL